jgi:hypothetical protein
VLGNVKISIFRRNKSKIRNFQQNEFWAKRKKKSYDKSPIKKFQSANFDRVGRVRGNNLIFNFGLGLFPEVNALAIFFRFFCQRLLRPGHKLPHFWETEIDKIRAITESGIGIRFRSNINNVKVPAIVYLKSFIFIAILRGNLGKSTHKTWKE